MLNTNTDFKLRGLHAVQNTTVARAFTFFLFVIPAESGSFLLVIRQHATKAIGHDNTPDQYQIRYATHIKIPQAIAGENSCRLRRQQ
jgi:hypothetical protein